MLPDMPQPVRNEGDEGVRVTTKIGAKFVNEVKEMLDELKVAELVAGANIVALYAAVW